MSKSIKEILEWQEDKRNHHRKDHGERIYIHEPESEHAFLHSQVLLCMDQLLYRMAESTFQSLPLDLNVFYIDREKEGFNEVQFGHAFRLYRTITGLHRDILSIVSRTPVPSSLLENSRGGFSYNEQQVQDLFEWYHWECFSHFLDVIKDREEFATGVSDLERSFFNEQSLEYVRGIGMLVSRICGYRESLERFGWNYGHPSLGTFGVSDLLDGRADSEIMKEFAGSLDTSYTVRSSHAKIVVSEMEPTIAKEQ